MPKATIVCTICRENHSLSVSQGQAEGKEPIILICPNLDRRYRLTNFFIDCTRNIFSNPGLKKDGDQYKEHLKSLLGERDFEQKFERWLKIDYPPLGLIEEYPDKVQQIINAYSAGFYYPAVTAACCIAERILNRLIIKTRNHFKSDSHYKKVYNKESFDDWDRMLKVISDWQLISPKAISLMNEIKPIRHQTIHYTESYNFEAIALTVINKLIAAITEIFGVMNRKDIYLVFDVPGEIWVRSVAERLPFVKEFILPHCYHAHAVHDMDLKSKRIIERLGKAGKLTDEDFVELRKASKVTIADS